MRKNRTRPLLGWILLLLAAILIVAVLLGLEYLGRAQPQHTIDQLIKSPESAETGSADAVDAKPGSNKIGGTETDSAETANTKTAQ